MVNANRVGLVLLNLIFKLTAKNLSSNENWVNLLTAYLNLSGLENHPLLTLITAGTFIRFYQKLAVLPSGEFEFVGLATAIETKSLKPLSLMELHNLDMFLFLVKSGGKVGYYDAVLINQLFVILSNINITDPDDDGFNFDINFDGDDGSDYI
jgi:hypothetical protein